MESLVLLTVRLSADTALRQGILPGHRFVPGVER